MNLKNRSFAWTLVASLIQIVASERYDQATSDPGTKLRSACGQLSHEIDPKIEFASDRKLTKAYGDRIKFESSRGIATIVIGDLHKLIDGWTRKYMEEKQCKSGKLSITARCSGKSSELDDLAAAITYAYFNLARVYMASNQLLATVIELRHIIGLRKEFSGVPMEQVMLLDELARSSLEHSCKSDLNRLYGNPRDLNRTHQRVKELTKQPSLLDSEITERDLALARELADEVRDVLNIREEEPQTAASDIAA